MQRLLSWNAKSVLYPLNFSPCSYRVTTHEVETACMSSQRLIHKPGINFDVILYVWQYRSSLYRVYDNSALFVHLAFTWQFGIISQISPIYSWL